MARTNDSVMFLRLPSVMLEALRQEAQLRGVSVSDLVRERIQQTSVVVKPRFQPATKVWTPEKSGRILHLSKSKKKKVP